MPRFVILEHDHPTLHWDLMLEAPAVLQTWRLAQPPTLGLAVAALALGDHRVAYLEYEGPVSGNRGVVKRWDTGTFDDLPESVANARRLEFHGLRVCGVVVLQQLESAGWEFTWQA